MKKLSAILLLCLLFVIFSSSAYADTKNFQVSVGGTMINVKAPDGFHEVTSLLPGYKRFFKTLTPQSNRLLGALLSEEDLEKAKKNQQPALDQYFMLQVACQIENQYVSSSDFQKLISNIKNEQNTLLKKVKNQVSDEVSNNFSEEYSIPVDIKVGEPIPLGTFIEKPEAYGFGNLVRYQVSSGGEKIVYDMVVGMSFLRIKNRLLFAYAYNLYESEKDINWTKSKLVEWINSMQMINSK